MQLSVIQNKIYDIRGHKVMLDFELASLYEVTTKALNQAVKRNLEKFPEEFMFRLNDSELRNMRSQFVTASQHKRNRENMPFAFTEHGIAMLASVLKSEKAVETNIFIIKAFIAMRQYALNFKELSDQINLIRQSTANHSEQLAQIYNFIENILDDKSTQKTWDNRERIGFIK